MAVTGPDQAMNVDARPYEAPDGLEGPLDFRVAVSREGPHVVVEVSGEVDVYTAPQLRQVLMDVIDGRGVDVLDVDLAHLGFIDSTGLGVIVGALRRIRADGGDLRLLNPRPGVEKALQITGLADILRVVVSRP
ncbi:MAG: anti-sigma factor antagonist [Actinomycetota bacterium]|nr:anti-sigma factor antagonist [Actinomycetota bacterium]